MKTVTLRNKWRETINKVDDQFLLMVDELYKKYTENEVDFFDELPLEIQSLLLKSQGQAKQGKVTPHKEVMEKYRQKYNV